MKIFCRVWQAAKRCYDRGKTVNIDGKINEKSGHMPKKYGQIKKKIRFPAYSVKKSCRNGRRTPNSNVLSFVKDSTNKFQSIYYKGVLFSEKLYVLPDNKVFSSNL